MVVKNHFYEQRPENFYDVQLWVAAVYIIYKKWATNLSSVIWWLIRIYSELSVWVSNGMTREVLSTDACFCSAEISWKPHRHSSMSTSQWLYKIYYILYFIQSLVHHSNCVRISLTWVFFLRLMQGKHVCYLPYFYWYSVLKLITQ